MRAACASARLVERWVVLGHVVARSLDDGRIQWGDLCPSANGQGLGMKVQTWAFVCRRGQAAGNERRRCADDATGRGGVRLCIDADREKKAAEAHFYRWGTRRVVVCGRGMRGLQRSAVSVLPELW